jgi:hypothetical protein
LVLKNFGRFLNEYGKWQILFINNICLKNPIPEEGFNGGGGDGGGPSNSEGNSGSLIGQLLQLPLFCQLLVAFVLLLFFICVLLFCCCYCLRVYFNLKNT